jgi:exodeoxyribonuclease V alpha subunit
MNDNAKRIINSKLKELSGSTFRSSFHLRKYMIKYIDEKGLEKVKEHAYDFINKNLKPAIILNDGKQTPMKGHPVFIAQHATGTCCRGCLEKWHHIKKGNELTDNQVNYIVELIMAWINKEYK